MNTAIYEKWKYIHKKRTLNVTGREYIVKPLRRFTKRHAWLFQRYHSKRALIENPLISSVFKCFHCYDTSNLGS